MEIEEFVNLTEIDPVYFETYYYVKPEEARERACALLYRALQESGGLPSRNLRCAAGSTYW